MRKIDAALVDKAEVFVMKMLDERLPHEYLFHSKRHTLNVAGNAMIIGQNSGLTENELFVVKISALFHDAGYIRSGDNHEAESSLIATDFLSENQVDASDIQKVTGAILATKVPQMPSDRISQVLCDADLMHLTTDDYFEQMELLRLEWQETGRYDLTEYEFHLNSIQFFNAHQYHSPYGITVLAARKEATLIRILQRVEELQK